MDGDCVRCGEEVRMNTYGHYRQIIGWEETRNKGGANKITDRVTTGQVMHRACMVKRHQHPGQGNMFT
jgi:hypothetical protein